MKQRILAAAIPALAFAMAGIPGWHNAPFHQGSAGERRPIPPSTICQQ